MGLLNTCAKCGCEDNFLTTPPPCPTAVACPTEECSEVQYAKCIAYTGSDILCGLDVVVPTDTNIAAAINNIVDYLCFKTTIATNILCNQDIVVTANSTVTEAVSDIVSYFCEVINNLPTVTVVAGNGIEVTTTTVGNNTEYEVSAPGLRKYTETFVSDFDGDVRTIVGTDLTNCDILSVDPCSKVILPGSACDLNINVYFKNQNGTVWNLMPFSEVGSVSGLYAQIDDITGDITLVFNLASPIAPVTVRVVIIG